MNDVRTINYSKELYEKFVSGDYKKKFIDEVRKVIKRNAPIEDRIRFAENICIAYIDATGESPPEKGLNDLTKWLLEDDLKNSNKAKSRRSEYPIFTRGQINRRKRQEVSIESKWKNIEHLQREIEREMNYIKQTKPSPIVTYNVYDLTEEELKEKGLWKYVKDKFEAKVTV